ncbi:MAG TPA: cache domain-containing protein, partial [Myxococcota bacterium]
MITTTMTPETSQAPRFGLRPRLTLLLLVFALLPAGFVLATVYNASRGLLEEDAHRMLVLRARGIAQTLDDQNESMLSIARIVARSPRVVDGLKSKVFDQAAMVLERYRGGHGAIVQMLLLDDKGVVVVSSSGEGIGRDFSGRDTVAGALKGQSTISEVRASSLLPGQPMVIGYASPVRDGDTVIGVLVLGVNVEQIWKRIREAAGTYGDGSFALVTDEYGIRIAHSFREDHLFRPTGTLPPAVLDKQIAGARFGPQTARLLNEVVDEPVEYSRATSTGLPPATVARYRPNANAVWNLSVAHRMKTVPWTVFVQVPEQAVFGSVDALWSSVVAFGLLIVVIGVVFAFVIASRAAGQLRNMA